jgi:hypothetical protein
MGGFGRPWKEKKIDFCKTMEKRGWQKVTVPSFPPQRPHNSQWTRGGGRHQGVNLDFQRRVMNYESSRNLRTGKCDVISGKRAGCGSPVSRIVNSSRTVMKPGMNLPESVLTT